MLCIIESCKNEGSEAISLKPQRATMQKGLGAHVTLRHGYHGGPHPTFKHWYAALIHAMVATIDFRVPTPEKCNLTTIMPAVLCICCPTYFTSTSAWSSSACQNSSSSTAVFQRMGVPLWFACSLAAAFWVLLGLPPGHAAGSIMSGISTATPYATNKHLVAFRVLS